MHVMAMRRRKRERTRLVFDCEKELLYFLLGLERVESIYFQVR